jgi:hypothetical protein
MASEVEIANLALARLGDSATVASLSPPEGSAQAEKCARFYPLARDVMQEDFVWSFCVRRKSLALVANWSSGKWAYAYAAPSDMVRPISISHPEASSDQVDVLGARPGAMFQIEGASNGQTIILTNQPEAELRYTVKVTDTTRFSAQFVDALAWRLASMLAGPILKGDAGIKMTQSCLQIAISLAGDAAVKNANSSQEERGPGGRGYIPSSVAART